MIKRTYWIKATIHRAEIRKAEVVENNFTNAEGKEIETKYIDISLDDEAGDRFYLQDKNLENLDRYKRGTVADIDIRIDLDYEYSKKHKITIVDYKEVTL